MSGKLLRSLKFGTRPSLQPSRLMFNTKVHKLPRPGDETDFRPSWFYTLARVLSWTLIPYAAFYGTFVYDFGEHDHVFRPARVWLDRQKAAFFTLSPDEKKIVEVEPTTLSKGS